MDNLYCVRIFNNDDKVIKTFKPTSERRAEKICDGVDRQLNHDEFYTHISLASECEGEQDE